MTGMTLAVTPVPRAERAQWHRAWRWTRAVWQPRQSEHRLGFVYVDCMSSKRLPPVAAVIGFIDCINRGDIDGLGKLMTDDHELAVFGEEALRGRARNTQAWAGHAADYPDYVIHPRSFVEPHDGCVVVLGHTTGSHLGLPDHEARALTVIWLAEVRDGRLCCWRLLEDTPERRAELGLTPAA